jgi:predicted SAM-dependent methyltransferase
MDEGQLGRIGERLRRIPLLPALLDLRLRIRDWLWERRGSAHDKRRLAELSHASDLRINVGSSSEHVPGWISVDIERDRDGEVLRMDATARWPFADGSAAAVNSEHFIEHVTREQAAAYLREAYRVLKPGGLIRTSTPDLEGMARAYFDADPAILELHRSHRYVAANHADMVNNYFLEHGHRHIYDFDSLRQLLSEAGFAQIERASFGHSRHPELRGIDRHDLGPLEVLVVAVDAVKPLTA